MTKAMEYYNKAAGKNLTRAFNGLGYIYYQGEDVEQNLTKALEYFEKAVEYNSGEALFNAGFMYLNCYGRKCDYDKAFNYLLRAALEHQSFSSYFVLGEQLYKGKYFDRNTENALKYIFIYNNIDF